MLKWTVRHRVDGWSSGRYRPLGGAGMGQVVGPWDTRSRPVALTAPSPRPRLSPNSCLGQPADPAFRKEGRPEDRHGGSMVLHHTTTFPPKEIA
jgi:hypothetical protein